MAKTRQIGLRLDDDDEKDLKRIAQREGRTEQDILRDSLRFYVQNADDREAFLDSVERGWVELRSGLGKTVTEDDDFFETVARDIRNEKATA
jgi:predicted transcriptional regulator